MKSIILAGQATKAYCETCDKFMAGTYSYGPFLFDNGVTAENVMRAECDVCHSVIAVAPQSAPLLKEALATPRAIRSTMRLPQELLDYMGIQLTRFGTRATDYDLFLRALLMACRSREDEIGHQLPAVEDPILKQPFSATLSLFLSARLGDVITALSKASQLSNTSDVLRRLIVMTEQPALHKSLALEADRLVFSTP